MLVFFGESSSLKHVRFAAWLEAGEALPRRARQRLLGSLRRGIKEKLSICAGDGRLRGVEDGHSFAISRPPACGPQNGNGRRTHWKTRRLAASRSRYRHRDGPCAADP